MNNNVIDLSPGTSDNNTNGDVVPTLEINSNEVSSAEVNTVEAPTVTFPETPVETPASVLNTSIPAGDPVTPDIVPPKPVEEVKVEKPKKEKGSNNNIILIIMIVVTLISLALLGYTKFIGEKKIIKDYEERLMAKDKLIQGSEKNSKFTLVDLSFPSGTALMVNGEVYVSNLDNRSDAIKNIFKDIYNENKAAESLKNYKAVNFGDKININHNDNLFIKLEAKGVKDIYNNTFSDTLEPAMASKYGLIILNKDGTVSFISSKDLLYGEVLNPTKLDVKDVKDVLVEGEGKNRVTNLIKKDNTKVNVNDLIK